MRDRAFNDALEVSAELAQKYWLHDLYHAGLPLIARRYRHAPVPSVDEERGVDVW
jgi:hypothetical protein